MVLARVDAQGKMQIDGRKFAGLYAVVAAELQFAAAVSSGNDQAIAAGAHRNAGSGFFFARSAYAPVHFAADGVDGGCCRWVQREEPGAHILRARGARRERQPENDERANP